MKKKIVASIVAFSMFLMVPITAFASATAMLFSDETSKETACVGNSLGKFYVWGDVGSTSEYNVEFRLYGGPNSSNCTNLITSFAIAPGINFGPTSYNADKNTNSVGKVVMYGNNMANPKKKCIASVGINGTY